MFRIIHTSDWHLGQNFMNKSRESEHRAFLQQLLIYLQDKKVDALVVAGDIFDTGTPPSYAKNIYYDFLKDVSATGCQHVVIVGGNHDSVASLNESSALLKRLNISVIGGVQENLEEEVIVLENRKGEAGAVICAVPFLRDRDVRLSSTGESATAKSDALRLGIKKHYQDVYELARTKVQEQGGGLPLIATGHLTTTGGLLTEESEREIYIGTLQSYSHDDFPADFDYVALGHLHKKQTFGAREHIRYCGSPIPLSFTEAAYERTVSLVDLEVGSSPKVEELLIPASRKLLSISGSLEKIQSLLQETEFDKEACAWLEITIDSKEIIPDLYKVVQEMLVDYPVELLKLSRRRKKRESNNDDAVNDERLDELSVEDVFRRRLVDEEIEVGSDSERELLETFAEAQGLIHEEDKS